MSCDRLDINGVKYVREDITSKPGKRAVVVRRQVGDDWGL